MAQMIGGSTTCYEATTHSNAPTTVWDSQCGRCNGLLVPEHCSDLLDIAGVIDFIALRCLQCGELVDPVILRNRHRTPEPVQRSLRKKNPGMEV